MLLCIRYWNDPDVLQKLGQAMGVAAPGETTSTDGTGLEETEEDETGNEDESILHHAASVGDAEVFLIYRCIQSCTLLHRFLLNIVFSMDERLFT